MLSFKKKLNQVNDFGLFYLIKCVHCFVVLEKIFHSLIDTSFVQTHAWISLSGQIVILFKRQFLYVRPRGSAFLSKDFIGPGFKFPKSNNVWNDSAPLPLPPPHHQPKKQTPYRNSAKNDCLKMGYQITVTIQYISIRYQMPVQLGNILSDDICNESQLVCA